MSYTKIGNGRVEPSENSTLISKNVTVEGKRTSVRLEPEMWQALSEIAMRERCSIHDLCSLVTRHKKEMTSLTSAIRVFLMLYYRSATTEEGHLRAGHGNFKAMQGRASKKGEQENTTYYQKPVYIQYADREVRDSR